VNAAVNLRGGGISLLAERLLASQERHCSMELVNEYLPKYKEMYFMARSMWLRRAKVEMFPK
jgi:hypothetical protein